MSQERDTHFAGFAKLQWNKIEALLRKHGCIPVGQMVEPDFFPEVETLLTQGAYDLAYHVLDNIWEVHNPGVLLERTPDLTEWPVEPHETT